MNFRKTVKNAGNKPDIVAGFKISPLALVGYLFYPMLLGVALLISIFVHRRMFSARR